MGQKVHPKGFRLGVYLDWDARWFARGATALYGKQLLEDLKIRNYLNKVLARAEVAKLEIEKAGDSVRVIIHSGRPGVVIGKKGQEIDTMRKDLAKLINKNSIEISVQEVKKPELDAVLLAKNIAEQLERRGSYKKAMRRAALSAMKSGAKGIKIRCKGRLNGAEIAREEWTRMGSIPLHTLRADVDYGFAEALTTYGLIGVSVWLCRGEYQHA
ncbi:MAG TPA: 30S ribosomal protein S3 [Candidatus Dependentiae bacterium]|nr:30S ribosomal protein S3 [Candidatus Dependentiae bacterium]HRQ62304.1 30S ribosomal protein S3 [Candidatus Dependentiae bacterium]